MIRRRQPGGSRYLAALAVVLATTSTANALEKTADWVEALRQAPIGTWNPPPAPAPAAQPGEPERKQPLAIFVFDASSAALTEPMRRTLDALAAALTSAELYPMAFEVQWHADAKRAELNDQALPQRRAAAIYNYLQRRPGITMGRVMLRAALRKPPEAPATVPSDSIVIRVVNRGPL